MDKFLYSNLYLRVKLNITCFSSLPQHYQPERSRATSPNLSFSSEAETQLSRRPFTVTHLRRSSREGGGGGRGRSKDTVSSPLSLSVSVVFAVIWPNFSDEGPNFHPSFARVWAILKKSGNQNQFRSVSKQVLDYLFIDFYIGGKE